MRSVIRLSIDEVAPTDADVAGRLGMPSWAVPSDSVATLMKEGREIFLSMARPEAATLDVSKDEFLAIFAGQGRNAPETPLHEIVPRASSFALFVGTIGFEVPKLISTFFAGGDPAMAMMLDSFASQTANGIADALAKRFAGECGEGVRVLPYSPGYCGWHISGQRALFAAVQPSDIGVTLNSSFLMNPLKSVSGVLIAGDAATHRFRPRWTFCDECADRECGPRMVSVR